MIPERVANKRKSSFAARFLFLNFIMPLKKCVAYQRKSNLWDKVYTFFMQKRRINLKWQKAAK